MKIALSIPGFSDIAPTTVPHGGFTPNGATPGMGTRAITVFITLIIIVGILFSLWNVLRGGLSWIMSRGIKEKVKLARERVLFGIIGLCLLFLSIFFIQVISMFITGTSNGLLP